MLSEIAVRASVRIIALAPPLGSSAKAAMASRASLPPNSITLSVLFSCYLTSTTPESKFEAREEAFYSLCCASMKAEFDHSFWQLQRTYPPTSLFSESDLDLSAAILQREVSACGIGSIGIELTQRFQAVAKLGMTDRHDAPGRPVSAHPPATGGQRAMTS